jgi:hypothetical protein
MSLVWLVIGLVIGLNLLVYSELNRRLELDWKGWAGLLTGEALVLFCVAWSTASFAEGEPRAASMGLIFFGGAGVLVLVLSWRFFVSRAARIEG